jgi:hypothetical protein
MRRLSAIAPPKGKLGVLTVGMGAVATTFMAGVDLIRRKKAQPVGSLTQLGTIRLGKRTDRRTPSIQDFVPLEKLENIVFGGWDIFPDTAYEAAKNAAVLGPEHLAEVKKFLSKIRPMKAAFDQNYVKRLTGTHVKKARTKYDLALQIKDDIRNFQKKKGVSRTVVIWCGSTEIFLKPHAVYATPDTFVAAMKANHAAIAPSMLYAWAAITSGVPFANGAPNLTVDVPALTELARQRRLGQHRHLRMAGLSDADQGGFPVPRLDPGCADRAGFGFIFGSREARRDARDSGMAELLFQVADVRAGVVPGARSVHPVDEVEEYAAMDDGGGFDYAPWAGVLRLSLFRNRSCAP